MLGREHAFGHPALTDQPTGLANRLQFELVYSYLFEAGDRGVTLTVMLVSIGSPDLETEDRDRMRRVGEAFQTVTRAADLVAHLGHGRFALLLIGSNLPGARIAADRIEAGMAGVAPPPLSIGIAGFIPEMKESSELLEAADRALREAEEAGGGVRMA